MEMKSGIPKQCSIFLKLRIWIFFWTGHHISKVICDQQFLIFEGRLQHPTQDFIQKFHLNKELKMIYFLYKLRDRFVPKKMFNA